MGDEKKMTTTTDVVAMVEHTNLRPDATHDEIIRLCDEAAVNGFHGVAINGCRVREAKERLLSIGSDAKVVACVGFPLGACSTAAKVADTADAVAEGADEVDMVLNVGKLLDGDESYVRHDVASVVEAAKGRPVKVILECCLLTDDQKRRATVLCGEAGASFVKTSTGFSKGGATVLDVFMMAREAEPYGMGVKAAGGIHTRDEAEAMAQAGATRIGTSSGIRIASGE